MCPIKILSNTNLKSLLESQQQLDNLTFFAGLDISFPPPSKLPNSEIIIDSILKLMAPSEEIYENFLGIQNLNLEFILRIFQHYFDPDLKILEYFESAKKPNIIHKFLAEQMKKGNFVVTSTYDHLIQIAFGIDDPRLKVFNSYKDFDKYTNAKKKNISQLFDNNIIPLFKFNPIRKETKPNQNDNEFWDMDNYDDPQDINNILMQGIYKIDLFKEITRDRTIVFIGYSFAEILDFLHTFNLVSENAKQIIWIDPPLEILEIMINYINKEPQKSKKSNNSQLSNSHRNGKMDNGVISEYDENSDKLLQEFYDLNHLQTINMFLNILDNDNKDLYLITEKPSKVIALLSSLNTLHLANKFHDFNPSIAIKFMTFLNSNFKRPHKALLLYIAGLIFHHYNMDFMVDDIWEETLNLLSSNEPSDLNMNNFTINLINARILEELGNIYEDMNTLDKALKYYDKGYNFYKIIQNKGKMADILKKMSLIHSQLENTKKALELAKQAYEIYKELDLTPGIAKSLVLLGENYYDLDNYDAAIESFKKAFKAYNILGKIKDAAYCLEMIGTIYHTLGDFNNAIKFYKEAYNLNNKISNAGAMATILSKLGELFMAMDDFDAALQNFKNAYKINKIVRNKEDIVENLENLGDLYKNKNSFNKALDYYHKAYNLNKDLGNSFGMFIQLKNIAYTYFEKGDFNNALKTHKKAYNLIKDTEPNDLLAEQLVNIGNVYIAMKKYDTATSFFLRSYKLNPNPDALYNLARTYALKNIPNKAIENLKKAIKMDNIYKEYASSESAFDNIRHLKEFKKLIEP